MPIVRSRFWIEAGFIIAVAVVAGIERLSTWWIIAVVAAAWLIVAAIEIVIWARHAVARQPRALAPDQPDQAPAFQPREPIVVRSKAAAEPRPEPTYPRVVAVPAAPEEPEPVIQPELEPEPSRVVAVLPSNDTPREWNLWELDRATRAHTTDDIARNEERAYLLVYLREFAGPDGMLPADFDGLVRDAFGDVLHAVA